MQSYGVQSLKDMFSKTMVDNVIQLPVAHLQLPLGPERRHPLLPLRRGIEWPVIAWPMWYYNGTPYMPDGVISSISCMGNPAVWWFGLAGACCSWLIARGVETPRTERVYPGTDRLRVAVPALGAGAALDVHLPLFRQRALHHSWRPVLLLKDRLQQALRGRLHAPRPSRFARRRWCCSSPSIRWNRGTPVSRAYAKHAALVQLV